VLPRFSDEHTDEGKKWWTKQAGFNPNSTKSAKELEMKRKLNNMERKLEAMIIADHNLEPPPIDPFKQTHVSQKSNGQEPCTDKPTNVTH
jgi:hypothetical protein